MRFLVPSAAILVCALGASAQSYSNEPNTYRHGGTYSTLQSHSEQSCAESCRADTNCLAWSFLKPHTGIAASTCELKQTVGNAEENPLMTSGVSPRLSSQHQAAPRPEPTNNLLGGQTVQHSARAPRPLRRARRAVPQQSHQTPAHRPTVTRTAAPSRPSGRVLSANDPAIVRQGVRSNAAPAQVAPHAAPAPVVAAPLRRAAPQQQAAQERPYDNLRNREFPRYSVQDNTAFEGDTIVEEVVTNEVGAGS